MIIITMPILNMSDFNMPNDSETIFKSGMLNEITIAVNDTIRLDYHPVVDHIVKMLKMFKNKASWRYITIEYCYGFMKGNSSNGIVCIDLTHKGFLKRIYRCVFHLIHNCHVQLIGKDIVYEGRFIDAVRVRQIASITFKKISVFKPLGKRQINRLARGFI